MLKKNKQRAKQIIFHFKDSSQFVVYDLDQKGRLKNLKCRAQRTNYKKMEIEKAQQSKIPSNDSSTNLIDQGSSFSADPELYISSILHEEIKIEDEFNIQNCNDQIESLYSPLFSEQEKEICFENMISESDNFEFYSNESELFNFNI